MSCVNKNGDNGTVKDEVKVVNKHYGELNMSVVIKSNRETDVIRKLLSDDVVRGELTLEDGEGRIHKVDIMDFFKAEWTSFEDL